MQQFKVTLKNEKIKLYHRLNWFIILFFFFLFCTFAVFSAERNDRIASLVTIIILFVCFVLQSYFKNSTYRFGFTSFFFVSIIGWISMEKYVFAGLVIVLQILSFMTTRKLAVIFSKANILYPSFPAQSIKWKDLNQVILKDSLLTIDFKSNKLIQQLVDESKTTVDEKEFNDFCNQQLHS